MSKNTTNGSSVVKQLKEVSGLFSCFMEHQVTKTTTQFKWEGPKIPHEEWWSMLEFFQWSYDTTHSETQVRLFVNKITGTWAIWAFPQEAKTGMSARELDSDETKVQRARFNPTDGWLYFGTVHHHCSASAFQSSVDESNEKGQDGIHITVGDMNGKRYTVHDRLYLCGQKIEHDLSWFWDIGDTMASVPEWAAKLLPDNIRDRIARGQMCEKSPAGTTFPEEWRTNLIYKAPPPVTVISGQSYVGGLGYSPNSGNGMTRWQRQCSNLHFDLAEARNQLVDMITEQGLDELEVLSEMQHVIKNDKFMVQLIALMYRNDVSLPVFAEHCATEYLKEMDQASQTQSKVKLRIKDSSDAQERKTQGVPDYDGPNYGHPMA